MAAAHAAMLSVEDRLIRIPMPLWSENPQKSTIYGVRDRFWSVGCSQYATGAIGSHMPPLNEFIECDAWRLAGRPREDGHEKRLPHRLRQRWSSGHRQRSNPWRVGWRRTPSSISGMECIETGPLVEREKQFLSL